MNIIVEKEMNRMSPQEQLPPECHVCGTNVQLLLSCPGCGTPRKFVPHPQKLRCVLCGDEQVVYTKVPLCADCKIQASARETIKRLPVLNDPVISQVIEFIEESFESP